MIKSNNFVTDLEYYVDLLISNKGRHVWEKKLCRACTPAKKILHQKILPLPTPPVISNGPSLQEQNYSPQEHKGLLINLAGNISQ